MSYEFRFDIVWANIDVLLLGVEMTILLSFMAMVLGTIIGIVTAVIRLRGIRVLSYPMIAYVEVFRGTPALVQIVWIYYCLPIIIGIEMSAFFSLVLAMALNSGAYLSEVFRAGIQGIDKGHVDAAYALGFRSGQVTRRIILPQAAYRMIPAVGNVFITSIKLSSLCSVLGMAELMYQGQLVIANYFRPIEVFTVVAGIYLVMTYSTSLFLIFLERRLAWKKREKVPFKEQFKLIWASLFRLSPG